MENTTENCCFSFIWEASIAHCLEMLIDLNLPKQIEGTHFILFSNTLLEAFLKFQTSW